MNTTDCDPYACAGTTACGQAPCTADVDCATPNVCNAATCGP